MLLSSCTVVSSFVVCLFFKQKTAYEMRISDWSSDVCSSDLGPGIRDSGFGIREDKSLPQHYEANRNRFCESRIPNSQSRLLNVLHLLADLVDQDRKSVV